VVEPQSEPVFPVGFDDDALEEDLAHLTLALRAIAFGIRHRPSGSSAPTVYEIADRRLNR
jgi:hypothetical protein